MGVRGSMGGDFGPTIGVLGNIGGDTGPAAGVRGSDGGDFGLAAGLRSACAAAAAASAVRARGERSLVSDCLRIGYVTVSPSCAVASLSGNQNGGGSMPEVARERRVTLDEERECVSTARFSETSARRIAS